VGLDVVTLGGSGSSTVTPIGESVLLGDGTFYPFPINGVVSAGQSVGNVNGGRGVRFVCPKTGTLGSLSVFVVASSGNLDVGIYDTGDALAGSRTKLWSAGSTSVSASSTFQATLSPNLAVTIGKQYEFVLSSDNTTATFAKSPGTPVNAFGTLPSGFNVVAGGASPKMWALLTSVFPLPATITEASYAVGGVGYWFVGKIT
jgi:hypothetical protein